MPTGRPEDDVELFNALSLQKGDLGKRHVLDNAGVKQGSVAPWSRLTAKDLVLLQASGLWAFMSRRQKATTGGR